MSFLSDEELRRLGFKYLGEGVRVSRMASIYNAKNIALGDYSRIDDFCVLSAGEGGIVLGRRVHVAVYCSLIGNGRIEMMDYSGLSSRVSVYSSSDDYSGAYMTNPTVPPTFTNVTSAPVVIGKHVIVGAGSVILPGVVMEEGAAAGALSLIRESCDSFGIYVGVPARKVGVRSLELLHVEAELAYFENTGR